MGEGIAFLRRRKWELRIIWRAYWSASSVFMQCYAPDDAFQIRAQEFEEIP